MGSHATKTDTRHRVADNCYKNVLKRSLFSANMSSTTTITSTEYMDEINDPLQIAIQDVSSNTLTKITVGISGMTCASCVNAIEGALKRLPGVAKDSVSINLLTGTGTVVFGGQTNQTTIQETIENAGYDVDFMRLEEVTQAGQNTQEEQKEKSQGKTIFNITVLISGMTCASCVAKVEESLKEITGVIPESISIVLQRGTANFTYQGDNIDTITVENTIEKLGYIAENINITKEYISSPDKANTGAANQELVTTKFSISGMTCSSCVQGIEKRLLSEPGIVKAQVNLLARSASVTYDPISIGSRAIVELIIDLGYEAEVVQDHTMEQQRLAMRERMHNEENELRNGFLWALLFAIPTLIISMIIMMALQPSNPTRMAMEREIIRGLSIGDIVLFVLATPVQFWLAIPFYRKAYRSLYYLHTANMETLVSLGTSVAYFASLASIVAAMLSPNDDPNTKLEFFETSVYLITFIKLGKWLEALAKGKTAETITKLMDLQPDTAILVNLRTTSESHEIEEEREVPTSELQVGDLVKVYPGQRIPCDGKLYRGETTVDESMITGESIPVTKSAHASVSSSPSSSSSSSTPSNSLLTATINLTSPIILRATSVGSDTSLSRIVQLVQDAQASPKSPIEVLADKISAVFVPAVIVAAIVTFVIWIVLGYTGVYPDSWVPAGVSKPIFGLLFGITVLVIACPCGLGLASPTAVMVGTGVAAKHGILAKGGGYALEMVKRVNVVVFDKTGTLTLGRPITTDSWLFGRTSTNSTSKGEIGDPVILWNILGCVTSSSQHPLSRAIARKALLVLQNIDGMDVTNNLKIDEMELKASFDNVHLVNSKETPGRGLTATVTIPTVASPLSLPGYGKFYAFRVYLGNKQWMNENGANWPSTVDAEARHSEMTKWQEDGKSIVMMAVVPITGVKSKFLPSSDIVDDKGHSNSSTTLEDPHAHATEEHKRSCGCGTGCQCSVTAVCACVVCACSICNSPDDTLPAHPLIVAQLAIADIPRSESHDVVAFLKRQNIKVWMITGDNAITAKAVARQLEIDNVLAEVKPEQKSDAIRKLQRDKSITGKGTGIVAMVGDGINDSPALAQADVGISVGSASDVAIEAAAIVLIRNSLLDLITLLDLSHTVVRRIQVNFGWVFVYNVIAIPIAAGILFPVTHQGLPPAIAGLVMVLSSISVVMSSLFLRRYRPPKEALGIKAYTK